MGKFCIGIDLGGTAIKCVAMDANNKAGQLVQLSTPPEGGREPVTAQMAASAEQVMETQGLRRKDCIGVGIGAPGPIDRSRGVVIDMPSIPGMKNVPLRDMVTEELGVPATLENDANVAAYGEFLCGAGRGTHDMVVLTLGAGVGSGIILDGKILVGRHDIGGEIGHMIVEPDGEKCNCGQRGCLERYCSAVNLANYAIRLIRKGRRSSLKAKMKEKKPRPIDAKDIQEAAKAGDALAKKVWARGAYYLAVGLVSISRIFDPDKIILAGGMTKAGEYLMKPVREQYARLHWSLTKPKTELCIAAMGNDAGAVGAAGLAWQEFGGAAATRRARGRSRTRKSRTSKSGTPKSRKRKSGTSKK